MKKSGILLMAMMAAAGINSARAQEADFDGSKVKSAASLGEMIVASASAGSVEASRPALVPAIEPWNMGQDIRGRSTAAPFMNEEACAVLDAGFSVQPSKEEAVELLKPCLAALSGKYGPALKMVPGKGGLQLFVGDAGSPGGKLADALRTNLGAKAGWTFFGHKVALLAARHSVNKGWWDDAETVVDYIASGPSAQDVVDVLCGEKCDRPNNAVNMTPWDTRPITFAQGM